MSKIHSSSFGDVLLTVSPQEMYAAASAVEQKIKESQTLFDKMISDVKHTSSYWEGDAAKTERERFDNQNENFSKMISNLNNYVTELRTITGIYETTESAVTDAANELPAGILS